MKTNKYLKIERKNQLNLFEEPKKSKRSTKKKLSPRGEPINFENQKRRCEMVNCHEAATIHINGPYSKLQDPHWYCDKHWIEIYGEHTTIEKDQEGDLAETPPGI